MKETLKSSGKLFRDKSSAVKWVSLVVVPFYAVIQSSLSLQASCKVLGSVSLHITLSSGDTPRNSSLTYGGSMKKQ